MTTSTGDAHLDALYAAPRQKVDLVDVPDLGYLMIDGVGAPAGPEFTAAVEALFAVSYAAHFALKKAPGGDGTAPRVMPLEALWWLEGIDAAAAMERLAMGGSALKQSDRTLWHWRAMMVQLSPLDEPDITAAREAARAKHGTAALDALRYERWAEGPSAQLLHVGPYDQEEADIVRLHQAIADQGYRPRGRHHEIYLGDPRRSAPERLRTILRHPVEVARTTATADLA